MSSRPAPGRRSDSLFDSRYRIEIVYPRGPSGEVLRARDTLDDDRPVFVKRPAAQDAPPMRGGQEQNILNEKRALERLAGHPAVTGLRQTGQFRVGGQVYHYIVLDEPTGVSLETLIADVRAGRDSLPELEMLVIFDALLDAIKAAHDRKVIYNNADPASVYWDRQQHRLILTAWENAVLIDTDTVAQAQGVNRATDILGIGQLIYFVASGGQRLEVGRTDALMDLDPSVPGVLKAMINHAANPEPSQRYSSVTTIQQELDEVRLPLERERDAALEAIRSRLPDARSQESLEALREELYSVLSGDPGFPAGTAILGEIDSRLKQLTIQEDLHAVRVYITSGNMGRAQAVLEELRARAGGIEPPILAFLIEACLHMRTNPVIPLPAGMVAALDPLLEGDAQTAAHLLASTQEGRPLAKVQQLQLTALLLQAVPDVILLRPPLAYLEAELTGKGSAAEARDTLRVILSRLNRTTDRGLLALHHMYADVVESAKELESEPALRDKSGGGLLLATAQRGRRAAERILELLDVATGCVMSDPEQAAAALTHAAAIDPENPSFDDVRTTFASFHVEMDALRDFVPTSGDEITQFLADAQVRLSPYIDEVGDPRFQSMVQGVEKAATAWKRVSEFIALGSRRPALSACREAADTIRPLSRSIADWVDDYRKHLEQTPHLEELSRNAALGPALEAGWELWDRGRAAEAKAAGEQALDIATDDGERRAARRLIDLSDVLGSWLEHDGPLDRQRTDQAEERVNELFLPEEEAIRRTFSKQMPDASVYLRAMIKGIVEPMRETSAAGSRALFFHYVLRGMLALYDVNADPNFWREAALKTLPTARAHPAFQALDTAITRRSLVDSAVQALNGVRHGSDLPAARQAVRSPLASGQLEAAEQAVRSVDEAIEYWALGEFRKARQCIDSASERVAVAETILGRNLGPYKSWLQDIGASAEVCQQARRAIEQAALVPADDPNPLVAEAYHKIVEITRRDLGEQAAVGLREWRDTYNSVRDLYLDENLNKAEKLKLYEGYATASTFEQQPALPILRHWFGLMKRMPDRILKLPFINPSSPDPSVYAPPSEIIDVPEDESIKPIVREEEPAKPRRWYGSPVTLGAGIVVALALGATIGVLILQARNSPGGIAFTPEGPTVAAAGFNGTLTATPTATATESDTPLPTFTQGPTSTPFTPPPTPTRAVPTYTPTGATPPPITLTPTNPSTLPPGSSPVPINPSIATPTFVPTAQPGDYDLLESLATLPTTKITWNKDWFGPGGDGWQLGIQTYRPNSPLLVVRLDSQVLTPLFGTDAARKLTRVDATLELVSYDKTLLPKGNVFYGFGIESTLAHRVAVQVALVQTSITSLGVNQDGTYHHKTDIGAATLKAQISIQRNADGTASLSVNGAQIGQSSAFFTAGTPTGIYMYTSAGGVIVKVTQIQIHLD